MNPENLLQNLHLRTQKCTLGCPVLDRCLGGGIPVNSVTEFVAESGSGKTQFCLQLVLSAQLPPSRGGLSSSSLYIHTESPFPTRRLRQLSRAFRSAHPDLFIATDPRDAVFFQGIYSVNTLVELIKQIEMHMELVHWRSRLPVRIIVIDSIAALFRSDFDNTGSDLRRRSSLFFEISGAFKSLANRYGLAVVVTNQVVDLIGGECEGMNGVRIGNLSGLFSSGRRIGPALGLGWANCVNTRLFLSREYEEVKRDGGVCEGSKTTRRLSVLFAPHLPESSCEFVIKGEGVFGVEMQQQQQQQQEERA